MKKLLFFISIALILAGLSGCVKEEMSLIYVCDYGNDRVVILDEDLNWVDSFSVTDPFGITVDENYIYVTCLQAGNDKIVKYNRTSPYAEIDSVEVYHACDIAQDVSYVYVAEKTDVPPPDQHYYVTIINKADMSIEDRFDAFDPSDVNRTMEGVAVDDDYIYCSGHNSLKKFDKATQTLQAENPAVGSAWNYLGIDSNYIYFTNDNGGIKLYNKSDLSLYTSISDPSRWHYDSFPLGDYVYASVVDYHIVIKVQISTDTKVAEFGVDGESGDDDSHLNGPGGIAIWPEEAQPIIALIG